jgi:hypothetical protein
MVRLAEDVRCTITGAGSVYGAPCNVSPLDQSAVILTPSSTPSDANAAAVMENFLRCDANPMGPCPPFNASRGSNAVDVIAWHTYPSGTPPVPEDLLTTMTTNIQQQIKSQTDRNRPMFSTEGSWGQNHRSDGSFFDPNSSAAIGFVGRYMLNCFSAGFAMCTWYEFDNQGWGTLCGDGLGAQIPDKCVQDKLTKSGNAFQQVSLWLNSLGSNLTTPCSPSLDPTIYTCTIRPTGPGPAMAVWSISTSCTTGCTYNQLPSWANNYYTLADHTIHQIQIGQVQISNEPILLVR